MKYALVALSLLLPAEDAAHNPRPAQARWSGGRADRIPLPDPGGACPGGFEAWSYDRKRGAICVRRA
jgi:hypothetical protein